MKRLFFRIGQASLRFLLRHWAGTLIVIFSLLTLLTAYQMWIVGPLGFLPLLPQLVISLVLLAGAIAARQVVKEFTRGGLTRGVTSLPTQVARGVISDGLGREIEQAKSSLSALAQDVKADWGRVVANKPPTGIITPPLAPRCPSCGRLVRAGAKFCDGCGVTLLATCQHCGRDLRQGAKFCDGCGKTTRPVG